MKNFNKYSRGVSIIGVECTPFVQVVMDETVEGITEGELFGSAAIEAMKDAGIESSDIEYYFHGQALPSQDSDYITPSVMVAEWFGMGDRPSSHHSEACGTGYVALEQGCMAVASGKYDVVLTGCVEMGNSLPVPGKPAHFRQEWGFAEFNQAAFMCFDRAYTRMLVGMGLGQFELSLHRYSLDYGFTDDQIDDFLNACAIANRYNASRTPLALRRQEYSEVAREFGFDDVNVFLKSAFNPKLTRYLRVSGMTERAEGAACCIIVPTDMVKYYKKSKPIQVVGNGHSVTEYRVPYNEMVGTKRAARQAFESTGVRPEEIDLVLTIPSPIIG
jgi:acetyl-CoA C-acetyltransferase